MEPRAYLLGIDHLLEEDAHGLEGPLSCLTQARYGIGWGGRVGEAGGVEHEDITVHRVKLDEVPAWLARKQAEGLIIDLEVWSGLYFAR